MQAIRNIEYDGTDISTSYGAWCISGTTAGVPERDVTVTEVPGRNGNLIIDNGRYKNRQFTLVFGIKGTDVISRASALYDWLARHETKYYQFFDPQFPMSYLMARVSSIDSPDFSRPRTSSGHAMIKVTFSAKPQRFMSLVDDWITLTTSGGISNPTSYAAYPLLHIYGKGKVQIGDVAVSTDVIAVPYLTVDTETMDATINNHITVTGGDSITLAPGSNKIILTDVTRLDINPRWWTL